jgi:putative sterol carrier protein
LTFSPEPGDAGIARVGEAEAIRSDSIMTGVISMADPVAEFFDALARRGHDPFMQNDGGTVRFDISRGRRVDHWLITFKHGRIEVAHRAGDADCIVIGDLALFEGILNGRTNAFAALLRGALWVSGDFELLVHIQRLFPAPPDQRGAPSRQAPPGRSTPAARPAPAARQRPPTTSTSARDRRRRKPVTAGR